MLKAKMFSDNIGIFSILIFENFPVLQQRILSQNYKYLEAPLFQCNTRPLLFLCGFLARIMGRNSQFSVFWTQTLKVVTRVNFLFCGFPMFNFCSSFYSSSFYNNFKYANDKKQPHQPKFIHTRHHSVVLYLTVKHLHVWFYVSAITN